MTAQAVNAMSMSEKLQIMEAIWEDLRERFEHLKLSPECEELLDQRRARVQDGAARLHDLDEVKSTIGRP